MAAVDRDSAGTAESPSVNLVVGVGSSGLCDLAESAQNQDRMQTGRNIHYQTEIADFCASTRCCRMSEECRTTRECRIAKLASVFLSR